MLKYLGFIILLFSSVLVYGQLPRDVFPLSREFKKGGFFVAPQLTYSLGGKNEGNFNFADSSYQFETNGSGKISFGLEAGWFHSFKRKQFIQLIEGAVAYRIFKGSAEHDGKLSYPDGEQLFESDNEFDAQLIVASFRAKNIQPIGKHSFLSIGAGVNYNYLLSSDLDRSRPYPSADREKSLSSSTLQAHLQIGIGFRLSRKLLLIPTLESPFLRLDDLNEFKPAFPFFSTDFHPLIFSLRFQFLREDPEHCNAPTYEGPLN